MNNLAVLSTGQIENLKILEHYKEQGYLYCDYENWSIDNPCRNGCHTYSNCYWWEILIDGKKLPHLYCSSTDRFKPPKHHFEINIIDQFTL